MDTKRKETININLKLELEKLSLNVEKMKETVEINAKEVMFRVHNHGRHEAVDMYLNEMTVLRR